MSHLIKTFERWDAIKVSIDFMSNWWELSNTCITKYEDWLIVCLFCMKKWNKELKKVFWNFVKDGKKLMWQMIFNLWLMILLSFYVRILRYFYSGLKSNFSCKALAFSHNWMILIDVLFQLLGLLAVRYFVIKKMSSSVIVKDLKGLPVL